MTLGRFALTGVAAAAMWVSATGAWAVGLGRLAVQSSLGEVMRAEIELTDVTPQDAASLRARIASADAYRAAGVDYTAVLAATQAVIVRRPDGRVFLRLTSDRVVQEPFVDVILEVSWASGRL
jgi:pilus assembly protein FimV